MRIEQHPKPFSRPPFVRKRTQEVSCVVVHHNGGGGNAAATWRALRGRYLSCHYVVESSGRIVQLASEDLVTLHAGKANGRSIGIECQSRGVLLGRKRRPGEKYYADHLHGRDRTDWVAFTGAQRHSLLDLVLDICQRHGIPLEVPSVNGEAQRGVVPGWETYAGVLGHYMITAKKMDPGPREMDLLLRGFAGAPLPV